MRGKGAPPAIAAALGPLPVLGEAGLLPLLALVLLPLVLGLLHVRHLLDAVVREEVLEREREQVIGVGPRLDLLGERDEPLEDRGAHPVAELVDVPLGPDAARLLLVDLRDREADVDQDPVAHLDAGEGHAQRRCRAAPPAASP